MDVQCSDIPQAQAPTLYPRVHLILYLLNTIRKRERELSIVLNEQLAAASGDIIVFDISNTSVSVSIQADGEFIEGKKMVPVK